MRNADCACLPAGRECGIIENLRLNVEDRVNSLELPGKNDWQQSTIKAQRTTSDIIQKITGEPNGKGIQLYFDRAKKILEIVKADWQKINRSPFPLGHEGKST